MAALADCIRKALAAKVITEKQAKQIEQMVAAGQMDEKRILETFIQKAQEARRVSELQVVTLGKAREAAKAHPRGFGEGIEALLARDSRDDVGFISNIDFRARAVYDKMRATAADAYEALGVRRLGLLQDEELAQRVGRTMFGEAGEAEATRLGKELSDAMDFGRLRFNVAGGQIGKRKHFGLPQVHDVRRIATTPKAEWVDFTLPRVKRVFVDGEAVQTVPGIQRFLENTYDLALDDAKRLESGGPPGNIKLTTESRNIEFRGYDAWEQYSKRFGHGDKGLLDIVDGHLRNLAADTAALEILGPYPRRSLTQLVDEAAKAGQLTAAQRGKIDRLWAVVSGEVDGVQSQWLANGGAFIRSWVVSSKIGSAWIASFSDVWSGRMARELNGMPLTRALGSLMSNMSRTEAARLGIAADSSLLVSGASRHGEFAGLAKGSGRAADFVLRASGLVDWTERGRASFGVEWLGVWGEQIAAKKTFAALDAVHQRGLQRYGISAEAWDNIVLATKTIEKEGAHFLDLDGFSALVKDLKAGAPFLEAAKTIEAEQGLRGTRSAAVTARLKEQAGLAEKVQSQIEGIRDTEARLREFLATETEFAVLTGQDARTRAIITAGRQRGTWLGEIARTGLLFKSFPLAMLHFHLARGIFAPTAAGAAYYTANLVAGLTVFGAISLQAREVVKGRGLRDMTEGQFWVDALIQGGGLSIFEAMLESGGSIERVARQFAGPVIGTLENIANPTVRQLFKLAHGDDTDIGKQFSRFLERETPGSNIWYTRLMMQRWVWDNLRRLLDSDAEAGFRRQEQWARRQGRGASWWEPGEALPEGGPELGTALGK